MCDDTFVAHDPSLGHDHAPLVHITQQRRTDSRVGRSEEDDAQRGPVDNDCGTRDSPTPGAHTKSARRTTPHGPTVLLRRVPSRDSDPRRRHVISTPASTLVIGFDGDDTLWHNEQLFAHTQHQLRDLLGHYADMETIDSKLLEIERRNLTIFGYGVKGFVLSMIETAIEISESRVSARDIHQIVMLGKALLEHPIELLDGVADVVGELSGRHRLILVTKGDLLHQETKVAASGLADNFWQIEIVSEKDSPTYRRLLDRHAVAPADFVMIGNSVASDVLPVLAIGGRAIHVPYHITWALEVAAVDNEDFPTLSNLRDVVALVEEWSS